MSIPATSATARCVLLFARPPRAEARAKRLDRPGLPAGGGGGAEALFGRFRDRLLAAVAALPGVDLVVVGPAGARERAAGVRALPQRGATFAERLGNAFADARALGYEAVVAVPADVPALGTRQLAAAFERLASRAAVLGPSPDGGVYLIGAHGPAGRLLAGVHWRTPRVFAELAANAPDAAVLEPLHDVDGRAGLAAAAADPGLAPELAALLLALAAVRPPEASERGRSRRRLLLAAPRSPRAPPRSLLAP